MGTDKGVHYYRGSMSHCVIDEERGGDPCGRRRGRHLLRESLVRTSKYPRVVGVRREGWREAGFGSGGRIV